MILTGMSGRLPVSVVTTRSPACRGTEAGVAFGAGDGDFVVLVQHFGGVAAADDGRMPSSRAMIAAWQVRPPRLVTMAEARFITGSQFGSVMSVTSTSPALTRSISEASLTMRTWPGADLLADGATVGEGLLYRFEAVLLHHVAGLLALHGFRTGLQDVELAVVAALAHSMSIGRP